MYAHSLRCLINKSGALLLAIFLCFTMMGLSFAQDNPCDDCKTPQPHALPEMLTQNTMMITQNAITAAECKIWSVTENSDCLYSDHHLALVIDVEPSVLQEPKITVHAWDVDSDPKGGCSGQREVDNVYVNGHYIGQLEGSSQQWSVTSFSIPSNYLINGSNAIYIDTDATNTGCWCVGIGTVFLRDAVDTDGDGVRDCDDKCPGFDDRADADHDRVPDACDRCPGYDDINDTDCDGVPNADDKCPGSDDRVDTDGDGVPDGCDVCPGYDDINDTDCDGVRNADDRCPGSDDRVDTDGDGVPDGCDVCPGYDDINDTDCDGVPNAYDKCRGSDDRMDTDGDGAANGCDKCPGHDDTVDVDKDWIPDACDPLIDSDRDGISDSDEATKGTDPNNPDTDGDGVFDGHEVNNGTDPLDANVKPFIPLNVKSFGIENSDNEQARAVHKTTDGGCVIVGISYVSSGLDIWVMKLSAESAVEWDVAYSNPSSNTWFLSEVYAIQQTTDGGYIIAGSIGHYNILVLKISSDGIIEWSKNDAGNGFGWQSAYDIKQTSDGGYIITGAGSIRINNTTIGGCLVLKISSDGITEWSKLYGDNRRGNAIQQTADGGYIVAGLDNNNDGSIIVMKLSPDGDVDWNATYDDNNGGIDGANAIQQTNDGGYIVAGYTNGFGSNYDALVLKLSSSGAIEWTKTYAKGNGDTEYAEDMQLTADGGYIITGSPGALTIKLSSDGTVVWAKTFNGWEIGSNTHAYGIQQTTDGGYVIAGRTGYTDTDFLVLKIDSNGDMSTSCNQFVDQDTAEVQATVIPAESFTTSMESVSVLSHQGETTSNTLERYIPTKTDVTNCTNTGGSADTETGADVVIQPADPDTGETMATITFDEVTQGGTTTVSSYSHGVPPPSGFEVMTDPPTYYEINTTATFQGNVTVCFNYPSSLSQETEQGLKLFHYEDTSDPKDGIPDTWVDVTTSQDMVNNSICGAATSFSPFAIFAQNANFDADGDGYTTANGDCDDTNAAINPGATEVCDGVDNNCNGQIDENVKNTYYRDADADGYGDPNTAAEDCTQPTGYVADNTDCDDTNTAIHPGAIDIPNDGIDQDCNGQDAPCNYSISPVNATYPSEGGSGNVGVTTQGGCPWTAVSNDSWITITSDASGAGNGTVAYTVGANASASPRTGTLTIAGLTFTVSQDASACSYAISSTSTTVSKSSGSKKVAVKTQVGCSWTAESNVPWITITSGSSGAGNGTVKYSYTANLSGSQRTGTMTIAGQTFTLTQRR